MNLERDAALGRALDLVLPTPTPRVGARQRVELGIQARLTRGKTSFALWLAAGAAVLACVAVLWLPPRLASRQAVVVASWLSLERARAAVLPGGEVAVVRDDAEGTELRLLRGAALFHVQKGTGRPFVVVAGASRVSVVGTVFGVALRDGGAAVEVREGVVELRDAASVRRLAAGQTWPPDTNLFTLPSGELAELEAPIAAHVGAPPPAVSPVNPDANGAAVSVNDLAVEPAARPRPSALPEPPSDSPYQQARELERRGERAEARLAFARVAEAGGPNAEDAAFALVRIPAQDGEHTEALDAATEYRRAFPSGRYARDVDVLVLNSHLALKDDHAALRDANDFLSSHADDSRAWRFRVVRATGHARAGHCDLARNELATVPGGEAKAAVLERCPEP